MFGLDGIFFFLEHLSVMQTVSGHALPTFPRSSLSHFLMFIFFIFIFFFHSLLLVLIDEIERFWRADVNPYPIPVTTSYHFSFFFPLLSSGAFRCDAVSLYVSCL